MNQIPLNTSVSSGVALATFGDRTKILLLKRAKEVFWCHVAGGIEENETAWQTIVREFREEIGVAVSELYSAEYLEQFYESEKNCITIVPVFVALLSANVRILLNEEHKVDMIARHTGLMVISASFCRSDRGRPYILGVGQSTEAEFFKNKINWRVYEQTV